MSLLYKLNKDMLIQIIENINKLDNKSSEDLKYMEKNISEELFKRGELSDVEILRNLLFKLSLSKSNNFLRCAIMIIFVFYYIQHLMSQILNRK